MAQDDYYYEIQLSNKQLVFYFMAGATGLVLSFLAGVMVGRGVDASAGEVQAARTVPVQDGKRRAGQHRCKRDGERPWAGRQPPGQRAARDRRGCLHATQCIHSLTRVKHSGLLRLQVTKTKQAGSLAHGCRGCDKGCNMRHT